MATNFWELLQQHQGDLTKSGRTVADYLVQHAAEAQYLSISSLAKECCVAEATVFRFCRALGFEGYHEMRIALAQANATGALVNQHVPEPDADTAALCEHASALLMTTINGTQNNLSPEAVDKASELMHKARQVYCLGQGGSMYIANDICARFACISTKFRTAGDSHMQLITASLMTPEDVVLFVSYSGATRDMLETLRAATAAGAKIRVPSRSARAVPMRPCPASTCWPGCTSMVPLVRFVRRTVPLHLARMPCSVPAAMSGLGLAAAASTTSRPLAKLRLAQENSPLSSRAYSPAVRLASVAAAPGARSACRSTAKARAACPRVRVLVSTAQTNCWLHSSSGINSASPAHSPVRRSSGRSRKNSPRRFSTRRRTCPCRARAANGR
mgnify:CR=1 FL=1